MTAVLILIPAAGASRRMRGVDKLLQPVAGAPLLRHVAGAAAATGLPVLVTLPRGDHRRRAALDGLTVAREDVDGHEGMAASVRAGAAAAQASGVDGLLVLLADMPEIDTDMLMALTAAFDRNPDTVVRATTQDGTPGNPVILPARMFPALARVTGDTGARGLVAAERVQAVPLPGRAALTDLDTPEDWAAWRARQGR